MEEKIVEARPVGDVLDRYIFQEQATRGARLVTRSTNSAVLIYGKPVNHLLHFLIGFLTCGLWWGVWLLLALVSGEDRRMVMVDRFDQVHVGPKGGSAPLLQER